MNGGSLIKPQKCVPCEGGDFAGDKNGIVFYQDEMVHRDPDCKTQYPKPCTPGFYAKVAATQSSERTCAECAEGQYSTTFDAAQCTPQPTEAELACTVGDGVINLLARDVRASCAACTADQYQAPGSAACLDQLVKHCAAGFRMLNYRSPDKPQSCQFCEEVGKATYIDVPEHTLPECFKQPSIRCHEGTYYKDWDSTFFRRTCGECLDGQFQPENYKKRPRIDRCFKQPDKKCGKGERVINWDSKVAARVCEACAPGQYMDKEEHQDRECKPQASPAAGTTCALGQFLPGAESTTARFDPATKCQSCTLGTYQDALGTSGTCKDQPLDAAALAAECAARPNRTFADTTSVEAAWSCAPCEYWSELVLPEEPAACVTTTLTSTSVTATITATTTNPTTRGRGEPKDDTTASGSGSGRSGSGLGPDGAEGPSGEPNSTETDPGGTEAPAPGGTTAADDPGAGSTAAPVGGSDDEKGGGSTVVVVIVVVVLLVLVLVAILVWRRVAHDKDHISRRLMSVSMRNMQGGHPGESATLRQLRRESTAEMAGNPLARPAAGSDAPAYATLSASRGASAPAPEDPAYSAYVRMPAEATTDYTVSNPAYSAPGAAVYSEVESGTDASTQNTHVYEAAPGPAGAEAPAYASLSGTVHKEYLPTNDGTYSTLAPRDNSASQASQYEAAGTWCPAVDDLADGGAKPEYGRASDIKAQGGTVQSVPPPSSTA